MFCSKNYKPVLPYIGEINKKYRILCHYTITAYWKDVEPNVPSIDESIETLIKLSEIVWKEKIIWRYDPLLLFTKNYYADKLIKTYEYIASKVHNHIQRALFSLVEMYKKLDVNMSEIIPFTQEDKNQLAKWINEYEKFQRNIIFMLKPAEHLIVTKNIYSKHGIISHLQLGWRGEPFTSRKLSFIAVKIIPLFSL